MPKKKQSKKDRLIPFKDNRGRIVKLDERLTMPDLVKMGVTLHLGPMEEPLPDEWFAYPFKK